MDDNYYDSYDNTYPEDAGQDINDDYDDYDDNGCHSEGTGQDIIDAGGDLYPEDAEPDPYESIECCVEY